MSRENEVRRSFQSGAERLVFMLKSGNFPDETVVAEVVLLLRKGLVLCPEATGAALGEVIGKPLRNYCGLCADCRNELQEGCGDICEACASAYEKTVKDCGAANPEAS